MNKEFLVRVNTLRFVVLILLLSFRVGATYAQAPDFCGGRNPENCKAHIAEIFGKGQTASKPTPPTDTRCPYAFVQIRTATSEVPFSAGQGMLLIGNKKYSFVKDKGFCEVKEKTNAGKEILFYEERLCKTDDQIDSDGFHFQFINAKDQSPAKIVVSRKIKGVVGEKFLDITFDRPASGPGLGYTIRRGAEGEIKRVVMSADGNIDKIRPQFIGEKFLGFRSAAQTTASDDDRRFSCREDLGWYVGTKSVGLTDVDQEWYQQDGGKQLVRLSPQRPGQQPTGAAGTVEKLK